MKITLMLPTRGRPLYMVSALMSWLTSAKDKSKLEFIVVLDNDDQDSIDSYNELKPLVEYYGSTIHSAVDDCVGYKHMYKRHNQALELMTGDCLIMIADDFFCDELTWDIILQNSINDVYHKEGADVSILIWMCGVNLAKPHAEHHGFNKKWLDISKSISITNAGDAYNRDMAYAANLSIVKPDIRVYHLQRKLERANELNTHDDTEFFRKLNEKKRFEGNEDRWIRFYGEKAKDPKWRESVMHEEKENRYLDDGNELTEKFKEIMERFLDYYGVIPDKGYPTYQNPSLVRFLKNYER